MKSFSDQIEINIFSHLIETILYCRLGGKNSIKEHIKGLIAKFETDTDSEFMELKRGLQMVFKIHEGCEFRVINVLRKHFQDHHSDNFTIYLEIFSLQNKRAKQQDSSHFYQSKNQLTQKWIFNKTIQNKKNLIHQQKEIKSDLFLHVLESLQEILQSQNPNHNNTTPVGNNNKSYQIVIRSKCAKKGKFVTHVFHHERNNHQPSLHTFFMKTSLLDMSKYWEKNLFVNQKNNLTVGCYLAKKITIKISPIHEEKQSPKSTDLFFWRQPDRKLSSETKAQEKEKSSSSSFRFSLGLGDFPFSLNLNPNKGLKYSSAQISSNRKSSEQILQQHRPRYQSIYESKDEQMNVFILSPRKLSDQQSPKVRHLQQKPIKFEIGNHHGHFSHGISEQVIEEFVLQPDEIASNVSSDGFQILWDQGQGQQDKVKQEGQMSQIEKKNKDSKKLQLLQAIFQKEAVFIESLLLFDKKNWFI